MVLLPVMVTVGVGRIVTGTVNEAVQLALPIAITLTVFVVGLSVTFVPVWLPGVQVYPSAFPVTLKLAVPPGQRVETMAAGVTERLVTAIEAVPMRQPTCAVAE